MASASVFAIEGLHPIGLQGPGHPRPASPAPEGNAALQLYYPLHIERWAGPGSTATGTRPVEFLYIPHARGDAEVK